MTYNAQDELRIHVIMLMKSTKNTKKVEHVNNNAENIIVFGDIETSIGDAKDVDRMGPLSIQFSFLPPSKISFLPPSKNLSAAPMLEIQLCIFLKGTKTNAEKENVRLCPKICKFLEK